MKDREYNLKLFCLLTLSKNNLYVKDVLQIRKLKKKIALRKQNDE